MDNFGSDDDPIPDLDSTENTRNNGPVLSDHAYSTHYSVLMNFIQSHREEISSTLKGSLKQGMFAGGGAVAGGLLAGPIGGLVGGIIGSIVGITQSSDYQGFIQMLQNLEKDKQRSLVQSVSTILLHHGTQTTALATATTFGTALREIAENNTAVRDEIWKACIDVVRS
jgi:hypothetical protein